MVILRYISLFILVPFIGFSQEYKERPVIFEGDSIRVEGVFSLKYDTIFANDRQDTIIISTIISYARDSIYVNSPDGGLDGWYGNGDTLSNIIDLPYLSDTLDNFVSGDTLQYYIEATNLLDSLDSKGVAFVDSANVFTEKQTINDTLLSDILGVGVSSVNGTFQAKSSGSNFFARYSSYANNHPFLAIEPDYTVFSRVTVIGTSGGGALYDGFSGAGNNTAVAFRGFIGSSTPTVPVVSFRAAKQNVSTSQDLTGNEIGFAFQNSGATITYLSTSPNGTTVDTLYPDAIKVSNFVDAGVSTNIVGVDEDGVFTKNSLLDISDVRIDAINTDTIMVIDATDTDSLAITADGDTIYINSNGDPIKVVSSNSSLILAEEKAELLSKVGVASSEVLLDGNGVATLKTTTGISQDITELLISGELEKFIFRSPYDTVYLEMTSSGTVIETEPNAGYYSQIQFDQDGSTFLRSINEATGEEAYINLDAVNALANIEATDGSETTGMDIDALSDEIIFYDNARFKSDTLFNEGHEKIDSTLQVGCSSIVINRLYAHAYLPEDSTGVTSTTTADVYNFVVGNFINDITRNMTFDVDTLQVDRPQVDSVYIRVGYTVAVSANKNSSIKFGFSENGGVWAGSTKGVTLSVGETKSVTQFFNRWVQDNQDVKFVVKSSASNTDITITEVDLELKELYTSENYNK